MRHGVAALLAAFLMNGALAGEVRVDSPVPGHPGVTYETLLKQLLPDLARGDGGTSDIWVSQGISIRDTEGDMADTEAVSLTNLQTAGFRHEGKEMLAVMAPDYGASGWLAILAVYDMAPATPQLIDAVNAAMDRTTVLGDVIALSEAEGGLTVTGEHGNSNEYFQNIQVLMLRQHKLASVFYAGTYSLQVCGMVMKQTGELTHAPDPGKPYEALIYTITQDVKRPAEDCGETAMTLLPEGVMTARDVYHWDEAAGAYAASTNESAKLMGPE